MPKPVKSAAWLHCTLQQVHERLRKNLFCPGLFLLNWSLNLTALNRRFDKSANLKT
jgi:hypothetical protein